MDMRDEASTARTGRGFSAGETVEGTVVRIGRDAVFLDDIGRNLKTARELGMTTIKVDEPESALAQLSRHLDLPL